MAGAIEGAEDRDELAEPWLRQSPDLVERTTAALALGKEALERRAAEKERQGDRRAAGEYLCVLWAVQFGQESELRHQLSGQDWTLLALRSWELLHQPAGSANPSEKESEEETPSSTSTATTHAWFTFSL